MTGEQIRWLLVAVVAVAALVFCAVFVCKRKKKDAALALLIGAALTVFLMLSEFHSVSEYGAGTLPVIGDGDPTVTFAIDATAASEGMLFEKTELLLYEGESVLALLKRVCETQDLRIETNGDYVEGIADLYEFDRGNESGWVYTVNGMRMGVSAADYAPEDGDAIVWLYVTTYTEDAS